MNLTIGNQIKAARALANLNQADLAEAAGVNVNTIRAMEGRGDKGLVSGLDTVLKVQKAFEAAGIQFLDSGQVATGPGVALGGKE